MNRPTAVSHGARVIRLTMGKEMSEYAADQFGRDDGPDIWGAWQGKHLLGLISLEQEFAPGETAQLSFFAVDPTHQKRGIGTQLWEIACEYAKRRGASRLLIETYEGDRYAKARAFYIKQGCTLVGYLAGVEGASPTTLYFAQHF